MLDSSNTKFPDQLRKARMKAGHSQTSLASALGVSSGTISNWETGVGLPRNEEAVNKLNKELFQDDGSPKINGNTLVLKSPTSKKAGTHTTASSKASIKDFDTEDITKELKRRGYTVTLVI